MASRWTAGDGCRITVTISSVPCKRHRDGLQGRKKMSTGGINFQCLKVYLSMASRTNHFVISSGVLLLLSLSTASSANFTMGEFVDKVGTCFSNAVSKKFNVSLPMEELTSVLCVDVHKIERLAYKKGVPRDGKAFLNETLHGCFEDFSKSKDSEQMLTFLTGVCSCELLQRKSGLRFPCEAIANAIVAHDEEKAQKLFNENGLNNSSENEASFLYATSICHGRIQWFQDPSLVLNYDKEETSSSLFSSNANKKNQV
ncbi:hypothetical protein WDU94_010860 [Cyamophila willieti]